MKNNMNEKEKALFMSEQMKSILSSEPALEKIAKQLNLSKNEVERDIEYLKNEFDSLAKTGEVDMVKFTNEFVPMIEKINKALF